MTRYRMGPIPGRVIAGRESSRDENSHVNRLLPEIVTSSKFHVIVKGQFQKPSNHGNTVTMITIVGLTIDLSLPDSITVPQQGSDHIEHPQQMVVRPPD